MKVKIYGGKFPPGGSLLEITGANTREEMLEETVKLFKSDLDHRKDILTFRVWGYIVTGYLRIRVIVWEEYTVKTDDGERFYKYDYALFEIR